MRFIAVAVIDALITVTVTANDDLCMYLKVIVQRSHSKTF